MTAARREILELLAQAPMTYTELDKVARVSDIRWLSRQGFLTNTAQQNQHIVRITAAGFAALEG